ncbi:sialin-like [Planococcus citri]|uniref:sialin-like n=1 Tax=Planococcus citri TaxID=170843 RepID=UPI0031F9B9AA
MNSIGDDSVFEYDPHQNKTSSELQMEIDRCRSSKRYIIALLVCFGSLNMFILRTNLTIAIIEMMSNKTIVVGNRTITREPEFKWDSKTRGFLWSLFYYGFLATPLGGYLADKYGGVRIYGYGILVTAILTFFTPMNLRLSIYWFSICRVIQGVAEGMSFPSIQIIALKWSRPDERTKFVAFGYTGVYIGTAVSFPLCGYLAHKYDWTAIFYGTGMIALFWALMWFLIVPSDSPQNESRFSSRLSVNSETEISRKMTTYPWKHILTSKSLWMLIIGRITYALGYNIVALCFPLYLRDTTTYNTNEISQLSAIPNITTVFVMPLLGWLADYLIDKKIFSTSQVHRIYLSGSLFIAAVILISIGYISKLAVIIICLVLFKILLSFAIITIQVMPVCIAPAYSSLISGITTLWHTITMIITPLCIGFLVTDRSIEQWRLYFVSTAIVMILGSIVFFTYATSELQPWAIIEEEEDDDNETEMGSLNGLKF